MKIQKIISYYKREDVREAIVDHVQNKEVAVMYKDGGFGKRPEIIQYKDEIIEFIQRGAVSFHASEELWSNPLMLSTDMSKKEMDDLRIGWDFILDLDCKDFEYSKIAAEEIVKFLQSKGVKSISIKFSGRRGFHIGIPWEAMPKEIDGKETRKLFPELPRKLALYIEENVVDKIGQAILEKENFNLDIIASKAGINKEELLGEVKEEDLLTGIKVVDIKKVFFKIIEIDTLLISQRHLYRVPYTLNEKTMLVSLPIPVERIRTFKPEDAEPEKVKVELKFIDREKAKENEMEILIKEALFFAETIEYEKRIKELEDLSKVKLKPMKSGKKSYDIKGKIDEEYFPAPIKRGLQGLHDGKKRFLFILMNFLANVGWSYEEIVERVKEWNKKNPTPLKESYVRSQLKYLKQRGALMPPNYDNDLYYRDIGLIKDEKELEGFKNPVNHAKSIYLRTKNVKKK